MINMEDKINQAREKISDFWKKSVKYYGKEIALDSKNSFVICQIRNDENLRKGIYNYQIQYGFPQSGCITLSFSFREKNKSFSIDEITIYAPQADKEFILAHFDPQTNIDELKIKERYAIDVGIKSHTTLPEIAQNSNALNMLNFAIGDLEKAEVLGECRADMPLWSKQIPICHSTNKPLNKEKR